MGESLKSDITETRPDNKLKSIDNVESAYVFHNSGKKRKSTYDLHHTEKKLEISAYYRQNAEKKLKATHDLHNRRENQQREATYDLHNREKNVCDIIIEEKRGQAFKVGKSPSFLVVKKIGEGGHGKVFHCRKYRRNTKCNVPYDVAVKVDMHSSESHREHRAYRILDDTPGLPKVYYKETIGMQDIMVMELLGITLLSFCSKAILCDQFIASLRRMIVEAIRLVQRVHEKGIVHGDIKPENFVFGRKGTPQEGQLHLIDFGLSDAWRDKDGKHAAYTQNLGEFYGTTRYASVNAHLGRYRSRRDDLQSLAYSFISMLLFPSGATLPWDNYTHGLDICRKKLQWLLPQYPGISHFKKFLLHVTKIKFDEKPDYDKLVGLFIPCPFSRIYATLGIDIDEEEENPSVGFPLTKRCIDWVTIYTSSSRSQSQQKCLSNVTETNIGGVIEEAYRKKYRVSNVLWAMGAWTIVFDKATAPLPPICYYYRTIDQHLHDWICSSFLQGYNVNSLSFGSSLDKIFISMVILTMYRKQVYIVSDEFPLAWMKDNWKKGYIITCLASSSCGRRWTVVMSLQVGNNIQQVMEIDLHYPEESIGHLFREGYRISCVASNCHICAFIFNRTKGYYPSQTVMRSDVGLSKALVPNNQFDCFYISSMAFFGARA